MRARRMASLVPYTLTLYNELHCRIQKQRGGKIKFIINNFNFRNYPLQRMHAAFQLLDEKEKKFKSLPGFFWNLLLYFRVFAF